MPADLDDPPAWTRRVHGVVFLAGVALMAYGAGRLTDTIVWEAPPSLYFAFGIGMLAYTLFLVRQR